MLCSSVAGDRFESGAPALDADQIIDFAGDFDPQPFHLDPVAAKDTFFGGLAASGWHTAALTLNQHDEVCQNLAAKLVVFRRPDRPEHPPSDSAAGVLMGRVSPARAAENRERVVATAARLFRSHGVENVSIADVMAEAGLTVGAFYKQFDSKEALVSEAFAFAFDDAAGAWSAVTKESPSADALVEHYLSPRSARYTCPVLAFAASASHAAPGAEPRATYAQSAEALFAHFREMAELNHDDAEPNTADPRVIFAAMIGAALLEKAVGPTEWVTDIRSAVLGNG